MASLVIDTKNGTVEKILITGNSCMIKEHPYLKDGECGVTVDHSATFEWLQD
jgi:hypothetical protein